MPCEASTTVVTASGPASARQPAPALAALQGAYQAALKENNPMFQYECLFELSKTYKEAGNFQLAASSFFVE